MLDYDSKGDALTIMTRAPRIGAGAHSAEYTGTVDDLLADDQHHDLIDTCVRILPADTQSEHKSRNE